MAATNGTTIMAALRINYYDNSQYETIVFSYSFTNNRICEFIKNIIINKEFEHSN